MHKEGVIGETVEFQGEWLNPRFIVYARLDLAYNGHPAVLVYMDPVVHNRVYNFTSEGDAQLAFKQLIEGLAAMQPGNGVFDVQDNSGVASPRT